jgi:deoxycytidylate deaminase
MANPSTEGALFANDDEVTIITETALEDRLSPELVIGFVGPIGSGVTFVTKVFQKCLEENFGYEVIPYKLSDYIQSSAHLVGEAARRGWSKGQRVNSLQDIGNRLRRQFGRSFLVDRCVEKISESRISAGKLKVNDGQTQSDSWRVVHMIDSLKNPSELKRLQQIYRDRFYCVTVFAPENVRQRRLEHLGYDGTDVASIFKRDEHEQDDDGQNVRDTAQLSDFFLRNDESNAKKIEEQVERFLEILFGVEIHSPTVEERGMAKAAAAAANSACMSRQVGAAIYDVSGELLSTGFNDVPKALGGLYPHEGGLDHRCFKWGGEICHNDSRKEDLYGDVAASLKASKIISRSKPEGAELQSTKIRDLIEFSRSVHAEMEAIVAVARSGNGSTVNGTLFTTTFPCHNCARHIVAAGIGKVIYIEPYSKSLALHLHYDSISVDEKDEGQMAVFLQYEGVAPRNLSRFFLSTTSRKASGKKVVVDRKTALPVYCSPLDSYITTESLVIHNLNRRLEGTGNEGKKIA